MKKIQYIRAGLTNKKLLFPSLFSIAAILVVVILLQPGFWEDNFDSKKNITSQERNSLLQNYAQLPLRFEQNQGQTNNEVQFLTRGSGYALFLTASETILSLQKNKAVNDFNLIRMRLVGNSKPMQFEGIESLPGQVNYLIGRDQTNWNTNIKSYADVLARNVYPGIDLRYHGAQQQLEYDFIVSPGAKVDDIQLLFDGLTSLEIDDDGKLVLNTEQGSLFHQRPIVYQEIQGEKISIPADYRLASNQQVSFSIGEYDQAYPLIIDPILDYSTYLGAEADDRGLAITVDDTGHAYIAGTTLSSTFPMVDALQDSLRGSRDAFIVKLNPQGDALVYSTYLGGSGSEGAADVDDGEDEQGEDDGDDNDDGDSDIDIGQDIVVDDEGHLYIIGTTNSNADFPIINALQAGYGGGNSDAYLAKLSEDGSHLLFSTYFGGSHKDKGFGITLDDAGDIYIAGRTRSSDFPTVNALQNTYGGRGDAFVAKLDADGIDLIYSTYVGGSRSDVAKAIAVNSLGQAVISGVTKSRNNFPLHNALQTVFAGGGRDSFVSQLSSDGLSYVFSSYLGGSKKDKARDVVVDSQDDIVVVGMTKSRNFPTVNAIQSTFGGGSNDGFISKIKSDGSAFVFSTYFGGEKTDKLRGVESDLNDNIYVIGLTKSTTIIPIVDAIQDTKQGKRDVIVAKLSSDGRNVIYSSYLGGAENDRGVDIAVDRDASAYITGVTSSNLDFPTKNAVQSLFGGGLKDAFIAKIADEFSNQAPRVISNPIITGSTEQAYRYDVDAVDADGDVLSYILTLAPSAMSIDSLTGLINWVPDSAGDFNVSVQVNDGKGGIDRQNFLITIDFC